jgi:tetratricopeptide (TPR) repeat protein
MKKGLNRTVLNKKLKIKFDKAINLGKSRKYEEASELLLALIKETNEIPEAYLFLGRSYHSLNRMNDAIQVLRHYLTLVPDSAPGNFFLGRSLLSSGFPKNAIPYLKKAVEAHSESMHANGFLGIAYLKAGRSDIAINYLGKATESSTGQTGIYKIYLGTLFIRAVSNFKSGNTDLAFQMFEFLIEKNFDSILPYIYLGMIERHNNNFKNALMYYDKALEFSPNDELLLYRRAILLYKLGDTSLAVEELKKLNIEPDIDENIYLAYEYFKNKQYNKAVYYGNNALHNDNNDIDLHLLLGEINRELNKLDLGENHYKKAIKLDRTRLEARYGLSLIYWIQDKYDEMMIELKKIEISDPNNSICSYYKTLCMCKLNYDPKLTIPAVQDEIRKSEPDCYLFTALGEEYIKAGLGEFAEKWFIKAVALNKNFKDAYYNLIIIYKELTNTEKLMDIYKNLLEVSYDQIISIEYIQLLYKLKKFKETITEINKILPSIANNMKLLRLLANSYRFMKKWDNAIIIYQQVLVSDPENEALLQSLIYCLDHSGKINEAIELLNKALKFLINPSVNLQLIKGVLCYKNQQFDEALIIFRKALNRKPDDWRIYNNIGMIYKVKGITDFADQFFSRAREYKK